MDLDLSIQKLAEVTGLPFDQIKAEIQTISETGNHTMAGALAVWKSDHRAKIPRERADWFGRAILKPEPRNVTTKNGPNTVQDVHMIAREANTSDAITAVITLWGNDRIKEIGEKLVIDVPVAFKGIIQKNGKIINVSDVVVVNEDAAPTIKDVISNPVDTLKESVDSNELVHGWVGRVIDAQGTTDPIGFELSDLDGVQSVTIWFAGKYSNMEPIKMLEAKSRIKKGVEVSVYGYVAGTTPDIRVNAALIFYHD